MDADTPLRLSDLARMIGRSLDRDFAGRGFWVVADVSDHRHYPGKDHHYFDLVEKAGTSIIARMKVVAWREGHARIRDFERQTGSRFGNDLQVLVSVRVDFHMQFGLKLTMTDIDHRFTLGRLEEQRRATLLRLEMECPDIVRKVGDGYVTANRELPLPRVLQRIAIVASEHSAGYEDFMHTLSAQGARYRFDTRLFAVQVQGVENASAIADQLGRIEASKHDFDAVVIVRGGGAQTDLLIFDQFAVAKAIAGLGVPVLTGIGHLRNETISDMMAHTPTKTPTECGEFIVSRMRDFEDRILALQRSIATLAQARMHRHALELSRLQSGLHQHAGRSIRRLRQTLSALQLSVSEKARRRISAGLSAIADAAGIARLIPASLLQRRREAVESLAERLPVTANRNISGHRTALAHVESLIRLASPEQVLRRGFAIIRSDGRILADASGIRPGQPLEVVMSGATIHTTVTSKTEEDGTGTDL